MSQVVRAPKRFVLALTGGIASGKSNVANILREQGAEVVNADALGHEAYRVGTRVHEEVMMTS